MENHYEHNAPIFEVKFELQRPHVMFMPNLDPSSSVGFMALIEELIMDIYSMSDMITRVAQPPVAERIDDEDVPYIATYECELLEF